MNVLNVAKKTGKQSDQGLPCLIFCQVFCKFQPRYENRKRKKFDILEHVAILPVLYNKLKLDIPAPESHWIRRLFVYDTKKLL